MTTFKTVYDVMSETDYHPPPENNVAWRAAALALGGSGAILVAAAVLLSTLPSGWRIALGCVGGNLLMLALNLPLIIRGMAREFEAQQRKRECVRSGDYEVIEGEVRWYKRKIIAGSVEACGFCVADITFGGHPSRYPGLTSGLYVRITTKDTAILKLEVREETGPEGDDTQGG